MFQAKERLAAENRRVHEMFIQISRAFDLASNAEDQETTYYYPETKSDQKRAGRTEISTDPKRTDQTETNTETESTDYPIDTLPVSKTYRRKIAGKLVGTSEDIQLIITYPYKTVTYAENPTRATFTRRSVDQGQDIVQTIIFHTKTTNGIFKDPIFVVHGNEETVVNGGREYNQYSGLNEVEDLKNRMIASLRELDGRIKAAKLARFNSLNHQLDSKT